MRELYRLRYEPSLKPLAVWRHLLTKPSFRGKRSIELYQSVAIHGSIR